jgi:transcriptional regulator with XRE-family HTH domain
VTPQRPIGEEEEDNFSERLGRIIAEYGSRYALAKASGIPMSTLQNYTLGSKPGIDALTTLARVANVDLTWLLTGKGAMRGTGQQPGAALADVVMVDQYDPKSSLQIPVLVNQIPFSRHYLENHVRLSEPGPQTLLAIESVWNLIDISQRDLLLIDRKQATVTIDGVYLLNLPGFALRAMFSRPGGKLKVVEPRSTHHANRSQKDGSVLVRRDSYQIHRLDLEGDGHRTASKVVGRVAWAGRPL